MRKGWHLTAPGGVRRRSGGPAERMVILSISGSHSPLRRALCEGRGLQNGHFLLAGLSGLLRRRGCLRADLRPPVAPATPGAGVTAMTFDYLLSGLVALGLGLYLLYALVRPERF